MKRIDLPAHIKLITLLIVSCLLVADSFIYYTAQAAERLPTQTPQSIFELPTPSPFPNATAEEKKLSRVTSFTLLRTVGKAQIDAAQSSFVGAQIPTSIAEVSIYQLDYQIQGKDGNWQPVTAKVYLPTTGSAYPLFVFGSGTTGIADKCAPSLENMAIENLGNYDNQMIDQAAAGYVSVFPDYEGFHNAEETQAYFVSESEAKVLLGAIAGLLEIQSTAPALQVADLNTVFLAGYSQGGHAALSTAAHWNELPESVKLEGVIQYAGAADVEALFLESPWLASYLVDSYTQYYGEDLDARSVLQESWLSTMAANNDKLCVNAAYKYYPHDPSKVYTPAFLDAIQTHTWPNSLTSWQKVIRDNTPNVNLPDVPYLSIQGEVDPIVTAATQRKNVQQLCQQQKNVTYREYVGVNHFQIRQASFTLSNDWMRQVLSGQTPQSDCQVQ